MKIKLNLDTVSYTQKPTEYAALNNRISGHIVTITPADLVTAIENGKSWTMAEMTGRSKSTWKSQQILCADIDNGEKEKPIESPLTPKEALQVLSEYKLKPFCIYHTFSSSPEVPRFRVMLLLDQALTDPDKAGELQQRLTDAFNRSKPGCADKSIEIAKILLGSRPGSVVFSEENLTTLDQLATLPEIITRDKKPEWKRPERYLSDRYEEIEKEVNDQIANLDLATYIAATEGITPIKKTGKTFFNPCPICGHNDCFNVNGPTYYCFSANHPEKVKSGNIITYLQGTKGFNFSEAKDYFRFNILGYDPEEYKAAYAEHARQIGLEHTPKTAQETPRNASETQEKSVMQQFMDKVQSDAYKPLATGIGFFDKLLSGGLLPETLLIMVAPPGTGKTTLCQQIAEKLAENKHPVIYLNLEMSRDQMIAKAISARTYRKHKGGRYSTMEILQGYLWSPEQKAEIVAELEAYEKQILPYLKYSSGAVGADLDSIKAYLSKIGEEAKKNSTAAPIVFVDYLHLITSRKNLDDKELIKQSVLAFKEYAMKNHTAVIAIAASNRSSNKSGRITLESARDSSNIEYTADYQLSLNYYDIDKGDAETSDTEKIDKLRSDKWKQMILRMDKGRLIPGAPGAKIYFYGPGNTFYGVNDWLPADPERVPFPEEPEKKQAQAKQKRY